MEHFKEFKKYNMLNEGLIKKNSPVDIVWNILTLGQGDKIITKLKNTFGISSYLIKSKIVKLNQIINHTTVRYNNEIIEKRSQILKNLSELTLKAEEVVGTAEDPIIKDKNIRQQLKEIIIEYEIKLRVYGFNNILKTVNMRIKDAILKIKKSNQEQKIQTSDLQLELHNITKEIEKIDIIKRTEMLPEFKIKNIAIDVSNVIYKQKTDEDKRRLRTSWEKSKNNTYQKIKYLYNVDIIDSWLDLNQYKVKSVNTNLNSLFSNIKNTASNIISQLDSTTFKSITSDEILTFEEPGYYLLRITTEPSYNILCNVQKQLKDGTFIIIPFGTYIYTNDGKNLKLFSNDDIRFNKLNTYSTVFYYIPNLKSYIIQKEPFVAIKSTKIENDLLLIKKTPDNKMGEEFNLHIKNEEETQEYDNALRSSIFNILWKTEYVQIAKIKSEAIFDILKTKNRTNVEKEAKLVINNHELYKEWETISLNALKELGWESNMTHEEAFNSLKNNNE